MGRRVEGSLGFSPRACISRAEKGVYSAKPKQCRCQEGNFFRQSVFLTSLIFGDRWPPRLTLALIIRETTFTSYPAAILFRVGVVLLLAAARRRAFSASGLRYYQKVKQLAKVNLQLPPNIVIIAQKLLGILAALP